MRLGVLLALSLCPSIALADIVFPFPPEAPVTNASSSAASSSGAAPEPTGGKSCAVDFEASAAPWLVIAAAAIPLALRREGRRKVRRTTRSASAAPALFP